jgi:hypothetical protein
MPHEAFRLTLGCIGDFGDRGQMPRDPVAKEGGLSPYEWRTKERGGPLESDPGGSDTVVVVERLGAADSGILSKLVPNHGKGPYEDCGHKSLL